MNNNQYDLSHNGSIVMRESQNSQISTQSLQHFQSFKSERRLLMKIGKICQLKVNRYFILDGKHLVYYKSKTEKQARGIYNLEGCSVQLGKSKEKNIQNSLEVSTLEPKGTLWLYPLTNDELSILEKYLVMASLSQLKELNPKENIYFFDSICSNNEVFAVHKVGNKTLVEVKGIDNQMLPSRPVYFVPFQPQLEINGNGNVVYGSHSQPNSNNVSAISAYISDQNRATQSQNVSYSIPVIRNIQKVCHNQISPMYSARSSPGRMRPQSPRGKTAIFKDENAMVRDSKENLNNDYRFDNRINTADFNQGSAEKQFNFLEEKENKSKDRDEGGKKQTNGGVDRQIGNVFSGLNRSQNNEKGNKLNLNESFGQSQFEEERQSFNEEQQSLAANQQRISVVPLDEYDEEIYVDQVKQNESLRYTNNQQKEEKYNQDHQDVEIVEQWEGLKDENEGPNKQMQKLNQSFSRFELTSEQLQDQEQPALAQINSFSPILDRDQILQKPQINDLSSSKSRHSKSLSMSDNQNLEQSKSNTINNALLTSPFNLTERPVNENSNQLDDGFQQNSVTAFNDYSGTGNQLKPQSTIDKFQKKSIFENMNENVEDDDNEVCGVQKIHDIQFLVGDLYFQQFDVILKDSQKIDEKIQYSFDERENPNPPAQQFEQIMEEIKEIEEIESRKSQRSVRAGSLRGSKHQNNEEVDSFGGPQNVKQGIPGELSSEQLHHSFQSFSFCPSPSNVVEQNNERDREMRNNINNNNYIKPASGSFFKKPAPGVGIVLRNQDQQSKDLENNGDDQRQQQMQILNQNDIDAQENANEPQLFLSEEDIKNEMKKEKEKNKKILAVIKIEQNEDMDKEQCQDGGLGDFDNDDDDNDDMQEKISVQERFQNIYERNLSLTLGNPIENVEKQQKMMDTNMSIANVTSMLSINPPPPHPPVAPRSLESQIKQPIKIISLDSPDLKTPQIYEFEQEQKKDEEPSQSTVMLTQIPQSYSVQTMSMHIQNDSASEQPIKMQAPNSGFSLSGSPQKKVTQKKLQETLNQIMPKEEDILIEKDIESKSERDLLQMAQNFIWTFQFKNSVKCLDKYKDTNINFQLGLVEPIIMQVLISGSLYMIQQASSQLEEFIQYVNECVKENSKKPGSVPAISSINQIQLDLLYCELFLTQAMMLSFLSEKFQAFFSFRSGYNHFEKANKSMTVLYSQALAAEKQPIQLPPSDDYNRTLYFTPLSLESKCRFLFLEGVFNLGLSMVPGYFLKILSLIGINPIQQLGLQSLLECRQIDYYRAPYACLMLTIDSIELNPNVDKAIEIIKDQLKRLPGSPIFYWMASLLSWRYTKPDDALNLVNKAIWNCGPNFSSQAHYLKFEQSWYNISMFRWSEAAAIFQDISAFCLGLNKFKQQEFLSISKTLMKPQSSSNPNAYVNVIQSEQTGQWVNVSPRLNDMIQNSLKISQNSTVIMPHKCCIPVLLACCYQSMGLLEDAYCMIRLSAYTLEMFQETKTGVDEDISKIICKFLKRKSLYFMKYEVLYFVKEVTKLRDDMLEFMVNDIEAYLKKSRALESDMVTQIHQFFQQKENETELIELVSGLFLRIVGACLNQQYQLVYETGNILTQLSELLPSEFNYLLHHSFHWLGRCYLLENQYQQALQYLKQSQKYQKSEFSFEIQTNQLIEDIKTQLK